MSQPSGYQPPPYPPMAPPPVPPAKKRRGFGWLALGLVAAGGLLVGSVLGVTASSGTAAPAVTVTATTTATIHVTTPSIAPTTSEPTAADSTAPAGFHPRKSDFVITLKILKKECFGSAGCSIVYRIKPTWAGTQTIPDTGTTEVTYRVTGGDSGPVDNTFTLEGQSVTYDQEEDISTHSHPHLTVKVVDVSYSS